MTPHTEPLALMEWVRLSLFILLPLQAGAKCRDLGARSGLPYRADPRIESFILEKLITSS